MNKKERGITLIALIIAIVILVILAAVTLKGLTGDSNITETAVSAAEEYKINGYREKIEEIVHASIISSTVKGQEATVVSIANRLIKEDWVISAIPQTDSSVSAPSILVKVKEGYVYQVFYDSIYGKVKVEYVGKEEGEGEIDIDAYPNIIATYNYRTTKITSKTSITKGSIAKLELIYKDKVIKTIEKPKQTEEIDISNIDGAGTGWYTVRATSDKGKMREAIVNVESVSDKLLPPIITLDPAGPQSGGWYNTKVTVTLTQSPGMAGEMRYRIINGEEQTEEEEDSESTSDYETNYEEYTEPFEIDSQGLVTVYAWLYEGGYNSVSKSKESFKIDTEKPTIDYTTIPGRETVEDTDGWYKTEVTITIVGEDEGSGVADVYYFIKDKNNTWQQKSQIDITYEDTFYEEPRIIRAKAVDVAGNESEEIPIPMKKDTVKPRFKTQSDGYTIGITNSTSEGFTITAEATDESSGNSAYGGYITYRGTVTEKGTSNSIALEESQEGTYDVTEVEPGKTYEIKVIAQDLAGNDSIIQTREHTVERALGEPNVSMPNVDGQNGWYKSNIQVQVSDSITEKSGAVKLVYTLKNKTGNTVASGDLNLTDTITITQNGEFTLEVWAEDNKAAKGPVKKIENIKKDSGPQGLTLTTGTATGTAAETTIQATASATSSASGIVKYEFYFKGGSTTSFTSRTTGTNKDYYEGNLGLTQAHTYQGLEVGTSYQLYVKVKDNAGNEISTSSNVQTKSTNAHTWNSGTVTKAATCTATGVKTFTCTVCNTTKTENIAATGHTETSTVTSSATCSSTGNRRYYCSVCNTTLRNVTIPSTGHVYDYYVGKEEPTCTSAGYNVYECNWCSDREYYWYASALGHLLNTTNYYATCTESGYSDEYCQRCSYYKITSTTPALGHDLYWHATTTKLTRTVPVLQRLVCV